MAGDQRCGDSVGLAGAARRSVHSARYLCPHIFLRPLVNTDEDLGLLGKMAVEGLRDVACDMSDPVDVGPVKSRRVELRTCSRREQRLRVAPGCAGFLDFSCSDVISVSLH